MPEGPDWFAPKRYGFGSGPPLRWQGWALIFAYIALLAGLALLMRDQPLKMAAAITPFTVAFVLICARTTRGGWRWRWGEED